MVKKEDFINKILSRIKDDWDKDLLIKEEETLDYYYRKFEELVLRRLNKYNNINWL